MRAPRSKSDGCGRFSLLNECQCVSLLPNRSRPSVSLIVGRRQLAAGARALFVQQAESPTKTVSRPPVGASLLAILCDSGLAPFLWKGALWELACKRMRLLIPLRLQAGYSLRSPFWRHAVRNFATLRSRSIQKPSVDVGFCCALRVRPPFPAMPGRPHRGGTTAPMGACLEANVCDAPAAVPQFHEGPEEEALSRVGDSMVPRNS